MYIKYGIIIVNEVIILEPAADFLGTLNHKMRAKAFRTIELLKMFGKSLPMPHSRKITNNDVYELRVKFASDIVRLFYFIQGENIFVISSGYVKKSQKTDRREIENALILKHQYIREKNDESI